jgi:glycosyltransferase involved in cell wall biosynthesis
MMATNNSEKTLSAAIDSILTQSCTDYELIVIDNLSKDSTLDVLRKRMPKAIIISEPDKGIYDALNKGLQRATGEWIYVLGSDDQLANSTVLERVGMFSASAAALIYGNVLSTNATSSKLIRMRPPNYYRNKRIVCPPIFHQSAFVRRSVLSRIGNFPLSLKIHADHFLLTRAYSVASPIYINETICMYNNRGYSGLSLKNYSRSTWEQLIINAFFGASLWRLITPLTKNFVRALINTVQILIRSEGATKS